MSTARAGLPGRVDAILEELQVPAEIDADGDWRLQTDVGPFLLVIDRENGDLVAIQTIRDMEPPLTTHAEDMFLLMRLNLEAAGARFAALKDGDTDLLILTARLGADAITRDTVRTMLDDAIGLSRRLDELVESA